jgi:hypothetical protein
MYKKKIQLIRGRDIPLRIEFRLRLDGISNNIRYIERTLSRPGFASGCIALQFSYDLFMYQQLFLSTLLGELCEL